MSRNTHIRPEHIEAVNRLIYAWDKPSISWDAVCQASQFILGYIPTRSGLCRHREIADAFRSRKQGLRVEPPKGQHLPDSRAMAARIIAARDAEIRTLKKRIDDLMEQFERWQYNAVLRKVGHDQLNQPLPTIDRRL